MEIDAGNLNDVRFESPRQCALVVTSIRPDGETMAALDTRIHQRGGKLICIGDMKGPAYHSYMYGRYISREMQTALDYRLVQLLPWNHYARKNIGYLVAMQEGAEIIFETDDDNLLDGDFFNLRAQHVSGRILEDEGWINIYRLFGGQNVWPRGFPLEFCRRDVPQARIRSGRQDCPIQQVLVSGDPDVDAIYRMVIAEEVSFSDDPPFLLGKRQWCPFNSQATVWHGEAYPLAYLPSYCSFRMTDIWRSFVAQRCLWETGQYVAYHRPYAWQNRNPHVLSKDFYDELPGYINNHRICELFEACHLEVGCNAIPDNMRRLYGILVKEGLVEEMELALLEAWLSDVADLVRI